MDDTRPILLIALLAALSSVGSREGAADAGTGGAPWGSVVRRATHAPEGSGQDKTESARQPDGRDATSLTVVASWFETAGEPRKIFGREEEILCVIRLRNGTRDKLRINQGDFKIQVSSEVAGGSGTPVADTPALLPAGSSQTFVFRIAWKTEHPGAWTSSGIEFVGGEVKVGAEIALNPSKEFPSKSMLLLESRSFWLDEFPPVDWISGGLGLDIASYLASHPFTDDEWGKSLFKRIADAGFKVLFIGAEYYGWGRAAGRDNKPFNYWFPAGPGGDSHYDTPPEDKKLGETLLERMKSIRNWVRLAHKYGLKVVGYMDIVGIYSPREVLDDGAKAHELPTDPTGWTRMSDKMEPMRLLFPEQHFEHVRDLFKPVGVSVRPPSDFALAACFGGPSGIRKGANPYADSGESFACGEHEGFRPDVVRGDPRNYSDLSGSHHYHVVRQVRRLMDRYDFDGLFLDDQGRAIMNDSSVERTLLDNGYEGVPPSESTFGLCRCRYCAELAKKSSPDQAAMDSLANLVRHVRWQIKSGERLGARPDRALISSDYYLPWRSLVASEDASSTDQFRPAGRSLAALQARLLRETGKAVRCDWTPLSNWAAHLPGRPTVLAGDMVDAAAVLANGGAFWMKFEAIENAGIWEWVRRYQRLYARHGDLVAHPARRLLAHTGLASGEAESAKRIRGPEGVTVSLWESPPARRVIHVVRTEVKRITGELTPDAWKGRLEEFLRKGKLEGIAPAERTVRVPLERDAVPKRILVFDPDADGADARETDISGKRGALWDLEIENDVTWLKIVLPDLRVSCVAVVDLSESGESKGIRGFDAPNAVLLKTLSGHGGDVYSVAFAPDGRRIASWGFDRLVKIWDVDSGKVIRDLSLPGRSGGSVAFSPDGNLLAASGKGKAVTLWEAASGKELLSLVGHAREAGRIAFSPDGKTLASAGAENAVKIWAIPDGRELVTLSGHGNSIGSVAFAPDGKTVVTSSSDGTIRLWDPTDGKERRKLRLDASNCVAISPDGKTLAAGSQAGTIKLWDLGESVELRTMAGHANYVTCVAFSPDGAILASGSADNTVKLWDVAKRSEIRELSGHSHRVECVAFSPDGEVLVSGSVDKTIKVWGAAPAPNWVEKCRKADADGDMAGLCDALRGARAAGVGEEAIRVYQMDHDKVKKEKGCPRCGKP